MAATHALSTRLDRKLCDTYSTRATAPVLTARPLCVWLWWWLPELLDVKEFDAAFNIALSTKDQQQLLLWLIRQVSPQTVLGMPCMLSQVRRASSTATIHEHSIIIAWPWHDARVLPCGCIITHSTPPGHTWCHVDLLGLTALLITYNTHVTAADQHAPLLPPGHLSSCCTCSFQGHLALHRHTAQ